MDATDLNLLKLAGTAAGENYSGTRNPLEDDALALRLAVKLGLQVRAYPIYEEPKHSVLVQKGAVTSDGYQVDVAAVSCAYDDSDPYAATRRCIVRAAAAIRRGEGE